MNGQDDMNGPDDPADWTPGFLAASALLGEPLEAMQQALAGQETEASRALLVQLADPDRTTRARAVARVTAEVLASLDTLEAPWVPEPAPGEPRS